MIDCARFLARAMGERAKKTVCDQRWRYDHSLEWFKELELLLTLLRLRPPTRPEPARGGPQAPGAGRGGPRLSNTERDARSAASQIVLSFHKQPACDSAMV